MDNNIDIEKLRNYINDLEEKITPLTKSRPKKAVKSEEPKEPEPVEEVEEEEPQPVKKKKEQLIKAREVKKENMEKRNKIKKLESAKLLLKEEISKPKKELIESSESASEVETDEEIIVVKKKPKPKPKKKPVKKIIIQEEDSTDSESDLELVEEVVNRPRSKSFGKSHRNKKSVVKVHQHPSHNQPMNYFCD